MVTNKFLDILKKELPINSVETAELKSIINQYPFFQSARALYLKGLKNQDHFRYNNELKKTAAHTIDRTVLFEYITSETFEKKENLQDVITKKIQSEAKEDIRLDEAKVASDLTIGKPIQFKSSDSYSFHQWLQLSTKKPLQSVVEKKSEKEHIIDTFISNNPKIEPLGKTESVTIEVVANEPNSQLMTETLAKVYLEQKKFENAIQAYRILSLKYPEKSSFFANQIKNAKALKAKD